MADITKTGPMTYRQLQEENRLDDERKRLEAVKKLAESGQRLPRFPERRKLNLTEESYSGYAKSPLQQNAEAQGKNDYWGRSMFDSESSFDEWASPSGLQDARADAQPWYAQLAAGIGKAVTTAGTTYMDGILGRLYGIAEGADTVVEEMKNGASFGDAMTSGAAKLFDNCLSNGIHEFNEMMEDLLPNYRTAEEEKGDWWNHMNMNFWADGFIKNLGFTIGALYSAGTVLKGLGFLKLVNGSTSAMFAGSLFGAIAEGCIEANNMLNDSYALQEAQINDNYNKAVEAIANKYKFDPEGSQYFDENGAITRDQAMQRELDALSATKEEMLSKAHRNLEKGGLVDLLWNTIILTLDNLFVFGRLFARGFNTAANLTARKGLSGWGGVRARFREANNLVGSELVGNVAEKGGKYVWEDISRGKSLLRGAEMMAVEGNEEMMQEWAAQTSGEMYSPDSPDAWYNALINNESDVETQDFLTAAIKGFVQSWGDPHQWEQFVVGALTGLLGVPTFGRVQNADSNTYLGRKMPIGLSGGVVGEFRHNAEVNRRGRDAVNMMNRLLDDVQKGKINMSQSSFFTDAMNGYAADKDKFEFNNAKDNELATAFNAFISTGREADFREMVDLDFENMSEEQLEEIARLMDPEGDKDKSNKRGQWRNPDGTFMSTTEEGRKKMREKLTENKKKTLEALDAYKEALIDVRRIGNESATPSEEAELAWIWWKAKMAMSRFNDISKTKKEDIDEILKFVIDQRNTLAGTINDVIQAHGGAARNSIVSDFGKSLKDKAAVGVSRFRKYGFSRKLFTGEEEEVAEPVEETTESKPQEKETGKEGKTAEKKTSEKSEEESKEPGKKEGEKGKSRYKERFTIDGFTAKVDRNGTQTIEDLITYHDSLDGWIRILEAVRDGNINMLSAMFSHPIFGPMYRKVLGVIGSPDFYDLMGKNIMQPQEDFLELFNDVRDAARLATAYRTFNEKRDEYTRDPLALGKNRQRLDGEERKKMSRKETNALKRFVSDATPSELVSSLRKGSKNGGLDFNKASSSLGNSDNGKKLRSAQKTLNELNRAANKAIEAGANSDDIMALVGEAINNLQSFNVNAVDIASLLGEDVKARARQEVIDAHPNVPQDEISDAIFIAEQRALAAAQDAFAKGILDVKEQDRTRENIPEKKPTEKEPETTTSTGHDKVEYNKPLVDTGTDKGEEGGTEDKEQPDTQASSDGSVDTPAIAGKDHEKAVDDAVKADYNNGVQPGTDMSKEPGSVQYWKGPNTTEYPIHRKRGDDRPWHEVEVERYGSSERKKLAEKHRIIHEFLESVGAYSFLENGLVRSGDTITFGISKRLSKNLETKDSKGNVVKGMPVILVIHNQAVKNPQTGETEIVKRIIGDLASRIDRNCMMQYKWLPEFTNKVMQEYAKVEASLGDDDIYHVPNVESHIDRMYYGKPRYTETNDRNTINAIFVNDQGEKIPFSIGIYTTPKGKKTGIYTRPNRLNDKVVSLQTVRDGQPFLLMPTVDGKDVCVPVIMPTISQAPLESTLMKLVAATVADIANVDIADDGALNAWKARLEDVLAVRKVRVYSLRNKKTGDPFIVVSIKGNNNKWKHIFTGDKKKAADELLDALIQYDASPEGVGVQIPLQVSLDKINSRFKDAEGNEMSYNEAIGEVMMTNLPKGATHTIGDFFSINPIDADGKEVKAAAIENKKKTEPPVETTNPSSTAFDGHIEFTLGNGRKAYMSKTAPYDVIDEDEKPVSLPDKTRAYIWCVMQGLDLKDESALYNTPFSDKPFCPAKMEFQAVKPDLESMPETAAADIVVKSGRESDDKSTSNGGPVKVLSSRNGQAVIAEVNGKKVIVSSYQLAFDNAQDGGISVSLYHSSDVEGSDMTNTTIGLKDLPQELATFIAKDSKGLIAEYRKKARELEEADKIRKALHNIYGDFNYDALEPTGKNGTLSGIMHAGLGKSVKFPVDDTLTKLLRVKKPLSSIEANGVFVNVEDGVPTTFSLRCKVTYESGKTSTIKTTPIPIANASDININSDALAKAASENIAKAVKATGNQETQSEASKHSSLVPEVDKNDIGAKVGDNEYVGEIHIEPYSAAGMGRSVEVSLKDGQGNNGVVIKKLSDWMDAALWKKELVDRYTLPSRHLKETRLMSFSTREYWLEQKDPRVQCHVIFKFDDGHSVSVWGFTDFGEIAETRPMITDMIRKYLSREAPTLQQSSSISYTNPRAGDETGTTVMDVVDVDGNPASVELQNASHAVSRLIRRSNKFSVNVHRKDVVSVKVNRIRINGDGSFNSADITIVRNDGKEFTDTLIMYDFREMGIDEPFSFLGLDKEAIAVATTQPQQREQPQAQPEIKPETKPEVPTGNFADVYVAATAPNSGVQKVTPISSNVEVPDGGIKRNKATKAIELRPVDKDTGGAVRLPLRKEFATHIADVGSITGVTLEGVYVNNGVYNKNGTVMVRVFVEHSDGTIDKVDASIAKEDIGEYLNNALVTFMDNEKQAKSRPAEVLYRALKPGDDSTKRDEDLADEIEEAIDKSGQDDLRHVFNAISSDSELTRDFINELKRIQVEDFLQELEGKTQAEIMEAVKDIVNSNEVGTGPRHSVTGVEPELGTWDRDKELRALKKILPQLSHECRISIVNGFLKLRDKAGRRAYGKFLNGIITLADNAETGTAFHEAFHYVFNTLLSDIERRALLDAASVKFGQIMHPETLEEMLARDFQKYMINETYSEMGRFKRLWRKLMDIVRAARNKIDAIESLYRSIAQGRYGYEDRDTKVSSMAMEIEFLQDIAERDERGRLFANNGRPSNLSPMRHALVRTREFNAWSDDDTVLDENMEPCVLYLDPRARMGEFTLEPTTDADMAFFAKGHVDFKEETGAVIMKGPFQIMSADNISRYATYSSRRRPTSPIVGAIDIDSMTDDDIRRYHEWKTSYDRLTKDQQDFLGYGDSVKKEWESLPADVRERALECMY